VYPPSPYAKPRGSFETPVSPPGNSPTDDPKLTLSINCEWLPFIRGALKQLLLESTWNLAGSELSLGQVQGAVFDLIDLFVECEHGEIPFTCEGDFRFDEQPFGVWTFGTPAYHGVYVPGAGYQSNCGVGGDGNSYCGIVITCQLDAAVNIDNIQILYDYSPGSFIGTLTNLGVFDETNSVMVGTPLTSATIEPGNGQLYNSGAFGAPSSKFSIFLYTCSEIGAGGSCGIDGLAYILGVILNGHGSTDPCS